MILNTSESKNISPDDDAIDEVLRSLDAKDNLFAILATDDMNYMQTSGSAETGFVLEYQAGSMDQHFLASDAQISVEEVAEAFKSYLRQNDQWKSGFDWEKQDLAAKDGGCASVLAFTLVLSGFLSIAMWIVV
jgi:hypothetical protein